MSSQGNRSSPAIAPARRLVERAHRRVRAGEVEPVGHHVLGDTVGLAEPVQVDLARRQPDHAGGDAVAQ